MIRVAAGIVAGQLVLYGASFTGAKILLPLDILTMPGTYIPTQPGQHFGQPHNELLGDPVFEDEPARLFRHDELWSRRLPLWNPYQYCGVPSLSAFSPFAILGALCKSPRILPWLALAAALVSGFGMYLFARRVLQVSSWSATIAAWCYPVSGFFVLWQSYAVIYPVVWLPWLLCAVDLVVRSTSGWSLLALAVTTALVIVSGHLDMAGLILLASGLFALWELFYFFRNAWWSKEVVQRVAVLVTGWLLGFMLASPELLPALEYAKTGSRINEREAGHEERPPVGLVAFPQLVLPHFYGTSERESYSMLPPKEANLLESTATGFAGLIAALVIAPMAWSCRRRRPITLLLLATSVIGVAWCLNVPGIVQVMRLPGLNMLSYNRFVFLTGFGVLALSAIGLDAIAESKELWTKFYYVPVLIVVGLACLSIFRVFVLPDAIAVKLPKAINEGHSIGWIENAQQVQHVQAWFIRTYVSGALTCTVALIIWLGVWWKGRLPGLATVSIALLLLTELLFFGYGRAGQGDPSLYYPRLPAFEKIPANFSGRVVGFSCLPPNLLQTQRFYDARGYDGVDPARYVDLLDLAAAPDMMRLDYAAVQFFAPRVLETAFPDHVRLPPVLDLLGVRYLFYASNPEAGATSSPHATEYFVLTNYSALPRVFVPLTVELEQDDKARLNKLAAATFDPRELAYVADRIDLPSLIKGEARILNDEVQRIIISAKMETAGLVVLADRWDKGWRAILNGRAAPILRVDHALRGIAVPAGESSIELRYAPTSLRIGFTLAATAISILAGAALLQWRTTRKRSAPR